MSGYALSSAEGIVTIEFLQCFRPEIGESVQPRPYDPMPHYAPSAGGVAVGWESAVRALPADSRVLAIDGVPTVDWKSTIDELRMALPESAIFVDVRTGYADWDVVVARTGSAELADDPDFARLATGGLTELFGTIPAVRPGTSITVVFGPGAALVGHDVLWYVDLPKRFAEAAVTAGSGCNLGARPDEDVPATTQRLFYIDWPMLDRHRDSLLAGIHRWFDGQSGPIRSVSGDTLRETAGWLAMRPFRTRPTFNTTPWGGHWAQRQLGMNTEAPNTALGYELIAPESGVLIGDEPDRCVEIPFSAVVALQPDNVLGRAVHDKFGNSFPVRFDYLDTIGGASLSVHCHPRSDYMREMFGWPYTQHETYYVMETTGDRSIYLGLRAEADIEEFAARAHAADHDGIPFDIEEYVQTFPADKHQLFLIPAGTPHGSGEGNVVLEVSATPYLYSLRFYDWLRRAADGTQRPVHVRHAFANLDRDRCGSVVARDLVQRPRSVRSVGSCSEEIIGELPEMFFQVRRVVLDGPDPLSDDATDGFHVLTVVEGGGAMVNGHVLSYAETIVVPAATGRYELTRIGAERVRLVKALVP